jgi:predicted dehydrogenase
MKKKLISRRKFISAAAITSGVFIIKPQAIKGTQANSSIRIGLLGCGGRGTTVARALVNNMKNNCRIVSLADLFDDRLQNAKKLWDDVAVKNGYSGIDQKLMFKGANSFGEIANCRQCDMIILSSPDYFHPQHLDAVVTAGKHCYCEKPAAVDVEGCKKFIEIGKRAEGRLSLDVGFEVRSARCFSEVVNRILGGAIGNVSFGALHYHYGAISYPDYPNASPLERRIRQFYWDKVLSGDTIVDQDIHVIDIANWVMGSHPEKAVGYGSRNVRKDAGDIWDNWSIAFKYPGGVNMSFNAVQYGKIPSDVGVRFIGEDGFGEAYYNGFGRITGSQAWTSVPVKDADDSASVTGRFGGLGDMDEIKTALFIESIRSGKYHNQSYEGAQSALSAILGRMAAYSGKEITWDEMMASNQSYQGLIDLSRL